MTARLRPLGVLKTYIDNQAEVEVPAGKSVRETVKALGIPPEIIALVLVNDEAETKEYLIREGDCVKLIAVIGGG